MFKKKGKILIAEKGSAAIANHIAGEFVATFLKKEKRILLFHYVKT